MTVEDTAKKRRMDLQLLHALAYSQTWFRKWGYKLCHGSFGITTDRYQQTVEALSSIKYLLGISQYNNHNNILIQSKDQMEIKVRFS